MAKVQFQVNGLDSNTASIFNDDVTFDGNVDVNSISIAGVDIFTAISGGGSLTIEDNGSAMTSRSNLNLVGFSVLDDSANSETDVFNVSGLVFSAGMFR